MKCKILIVITSGVVRDVMGKFWPAQAHGASESRGEGKVTYDVTFVHDVAADYPLSPLKNVPGVTLPAPSG